ncbi:hypothetical protein, partial [Brachyspira pilosicoli]
YSLFEEEREKLERGFEEFSSELLNRLNDTDSDINYIKDMLSSDKNLLLEELDALRLEVENVHNDERLNELLDYKLSLEDSFNGIREELSKFDELEGSLNELRDSVSELDGSLLSSINASIDELKKEYNDVHLEIDKLNGSIEELSLNNENVSANLDTISSNFEV